MRGTLVSVAASLAVLASAAAARAEDLRVPGDFRNLQKALDAAQPGDRVLVLRGVHRGPCTLSTPMVEVVAGPKARLVGIRGTARHEGSPALVLQGYGDVVRGATFDRGGVRVRAGGVTVEGCTFRRFDNRSGQDGFTVDVCGDGAVVAGNRILGETKTLAGIVVDGDDAAVVGNSIDATEMVNGVFVRGDRPVVTDNDLSLAGVDRDRFNPEGMILIGSDGSVSGNRLVGASLWVGGDGNTVEGNAVAETTLYRASLRVQGDGNDVLDNGVAGGADTGFLVEGDGNWVGGNSVEDQGSVVTAYSRNQGMVDYSVGHGIVVRGSGNALLGNSVAGCLGDAYRVVGNDGHVFVVDPETGVGTWESYVLGPGNEVSGCAGNAATGCGLGNWTSGTSVTDSDFTDNGVDVVDGSGFDVFDGNTFVTGGPGYAGSGNGADLPDVWGGTWDFTGVDPAD